MVEHRHYGPYMRASLKGALSLLTVSLIACARAEPVSRTQLDVLSSRSEMSLPAPAGVALELTELGSRDGIVAGRVHQIFNCQTNIHEDVRRTDHRGSRVEGGWVQVGLAGAALAPGAYLLARAPSYSDAEVEGKASSRENAYLWGAGLTLAGAALLGHVGYLWLTSGERQSSSVEKRERAQPAVECQRSPAAGVDVALVGTTEMASIKTDAAGNFRIDLDELADAPPLAPAAPEWTLRVGQERRAFRPHDWWPHHLATQREKLRKRLAEDQRACDSGAAASCTLLGLVHLHGYEELGVEKDVRKAEALLEKGCRGGSGEGCFELGLIYFNHPPTNPAEAVKAFARACEKKHPGGCNNLGVMHEHGEGGLRANLEAAQRFYTRGCEANDEQACENLARARRGQAQRAERLAREAEAAQFRQSLGVGSESHCGLVVAINGPIAKVQAMVGEVWLKVEQLYPAGARSCRFFNNVYVDP